MSVLKRIAITGTIVFTILLLWCGYRLYEYAMAEKAYIMATYGIPETKDELLHRLVSKSITLRLYEITGDMFVSQRITYFFGQLKEAYDWFEGEDFQQRDLEADWQGCLDAQEQVKQASRAESNQAI